MNTTKNAAETLAQRIENTVANANEQAYNLLPLIDLITSEDDPKGIARALRSVYYEIAENVIRSEGYCGDLADSLYTLRIVFEAFENMENRGEHKIAFRFSDPANPRHDRY